MTVTLAFVPDVSAQVVLDVSCTVIGEGVQGYVRNPASLANRGLEGSDWFDWDVSIDGSRVSI